MSLFLWLGDIDIIPSNRIVSYFLHLSFRVWKHEKSIYRQMSDFSIHFSDCVSKSNISDIVLVFCLTFSGLLPSILVLFSVSEFTWCHTVLFVTISFGFMFQNLKKKLLCRLGASGNILSLHSSYNNANRFFMYADVFLAHRSIHTMRYSHSLGD